MRSWAGFGVVILLAGCWTSHRLLGEAGEEREAGARETDAADAAVEDDADAGRDGPHEDFAADGARDGGDVEAETSCRDDDDDGHPAVECGGDDCDDGDPAVHPGAHDACDDGIDTNCDGIDPHEGLLGTTEVLLEDSSAAVPHSWLLWTGADYVFVWEIRHSAGMFVRRISRAGRPADDYFRMGDYRSGFVIAWSGTRFGSAWTEEMPDPPDLCFRPLDSTTAALSDPVRILDARAVIGEDGSAGVAAILPVGDDFLLAWTDNREGTPNAYLTRVDRDGHRLLDDVRLSIAGGQISSLDLVWTGTEIGAAWTLGVSPTPDGLGVAGILLRRVTGDGTVLEPLRVLSETAAYQGPVRVVWTGAAYGVVWQEGNWPDFGPVVLGRVDPSSDGVERTDLAGVPPYGHGAATWVDGRLVLAHRGAEEDGTPLVVRSFDLAGRPLGSPVVIPAAGRPSQALLAWSGSELGIAWVERTSDDEGEHARVLFNRVALCE